MNSEFYCHVAGQDMDTNAVRAHCRANRWWITLHFPTTSDNWIEEGSGNCHSVMITEPSFVSSPHWTANFFTHSIGT